MGQVAVNPAAGLTGFRNNRWVQLITAIIIMVMIAGVEYGWSKYAHPLQKELALPLYDIQYAFTIGIISWGIGQPLVGFVVDRIGPRWVTVACGLAVGIGWAMMGQVHSLSGLYAWYFLAGLGGGLVYGVAIGTSSRWFPDKRGLANGLVAAGFGAGSLVFLPIITSSLKHSVSSAFFNVGIVQLVVIVLLAFVLKWPEKPTVQKVETAVTTSDLTPGKILQTGQFWLLWITFFGMQLGGLLLTANSVPYAKSVGIGAAFITTALTMQNLANGGSRIFWGWISDHLGRYRTMGLAFFLNAVVFFFFPIVGKSGVGYVLAVALAFLTWGEIYSLFPSVSADVFGTTYSTTSYGLLYSAKGVGGVFGGGFGAYIALKMGWQGAFTIAALFALFSSAMAIFVIPKMTKSHQTGIQTPATSVVDGGNTSQ